MFILMTIETQQLPVTPIEWIVVMVMVLVMDGELREGLTAELSPTVGTDPRKQFEREGSVGVLFRRGRIPCHESLPGDRQLGARSFYTTVRPTRTW